MDESLVRDLVNVFRQIDEIRGITQVIEPAPACDYCQGFGRIPSRYHHLRAVCPACGGSGWAHLPG